MRVVVASVAVHALVFGVLAGVTVGRHHAVAPAPVASPPAVAETLVEVVFMPEEPARGAAPVAAPSASHGGPGLAERPTASARTAAIEAAHGPGPDMGIGIGPGPGPGPGPGIETDTGTGTGTGKGKGTWDLSLAPESAERIAAAGRPLEGPAVKSGKLENVSGGSAVVHDAVTTMSIERDGNAHFADKPDIDIKIKLPIPHLDLEEMRRDAGRVLTDWYRDPYANTKFGRKAEVSRVIMAVPGSCDSWGDTWCDDALAPGQEKYAREQKRTGGSILGGTADISAWLQRKLVGDPYASRKKKLLDDTREERIERGAMFRGEQLAKSSELMTRTLEDLWRREPDAATRRELLFELWDDCAEGEGPTGEAGERARAIVVGWIRARMPAGGPGAFSVEEIARLQARRTSKQAFTPY